LADLCIAVEEVLSRGEQIKEEYRNMHAPEPAQGACIMEKIETTYEFVL
jgi:hypothetical protein